LALWTYDLLPPPETTNVELGEKREINFSPCHLYFGKEVDMDYGSNSELPRKEQNFKRTEYIWHEMEKNYNVIIEES